MNIQYKHLWLASAFAVIFLMALFLTEYDLASRVYLGILSFVAFMLFAEVLQ